MDCSLNSLLRQSAKDLLATCPLYEPFVPHSQQNQLYALLLLGNLGEITTQSLIQMPPPSLPSHSSPFSAPLSKDALLIRALMELRNSTRYPKKPGQPFSPILRPQP